ncbi:MAG: sulfotransferase family 2 domain-containing protein [Pseudomonadota bacterium]
MPLITAHNKRIFFAHVPKTGGSSVEDYLLRRFGGPFSLRDITHRRKDRKRGLIALSTHLAVEDLEDVLPHDVDHLFAVVREPFSRMKSQYRFQAGISKTRNFDLHTWLRIILKTAEIDPRVYQNHIRPQSELVHKDSAVFKLEDKFTDMIEWLDEVTGTTDPDIEVGHLLKRKREPIEFSREDVQLITEFYRDDYDRFGYERPNLDDFESKPFPSWKLPMVTALAHGVVKKQHRHWLR